MRAGELREAPAGTSIRQMTRPAAMTTNTVAATSMKDFKRFMQPPSEAPLYSTAQVRHKTTNDVQIERMDVCQKHIDDLSDERAHGSGASA